jgi:uncharacterized protein YggE
LKEAGVEDKNIATASLTFSPEYEYAANKRVLVGQKVAQEITFSIDNIIESDERASKIIDELIGIDGIVLNRMNFSVKNSEEYFVRSRELAFEKALEKAEQYAALSKLKIKKVLSVSEEGTQSTPPSERFKVLRAEAAADYSGSTTLPAGELEITSRIQVVFLLK